MMIQSPARIEAPPILKTPRDVLRRIEPIHPVGRERLILFTLTDTYHLIDEHLLALGEPPAGVTRDLFRYALYDRAAAFVVAQCRLEDRPRPTSSERYLAHDIHEMAGIVELEMVDFLVVGPERYISMVEKGEIKNAELPF
jgi:DNA repair protein RadC